MDHRIGDLSNRRNGGLPPAFRRTIAPSFNTSDESILHALDDAVVILDADTNISLVNAAALRLTGFDESELLGHSGERLLRNKRSLSKIFRRSFEPVEPARRLETFVRKKDGSCFPVSLSTTRIYDPEEGADRIVCIAQDISRRKRLEAEARVISKIIRGVTSTANLDELLALIHRSIKKILYAENCFVALFDPETEMLSMQFFVDRYDEIPPPFSIRRGLAAYVFRKAQPMLLTSEAVRALIEKGEVELVGTDSPIWLGVPLKTPNGVIGVLVVQDYENSDTYIQKDVDLLTAVADQIALAIERKRTEEALRITQERFDLVTRATSDAIWDWNLETGKLWWNQGFHQLFGYAADEEGSDIESWIGRVHPEDSDRVTHEIYRHIEGGKQNWTGEYRFRRHDGSYASVIDRGYVVHDVEGTPIRMLCSIMDVTDRKSLEEQLTHQALHDPLTKIANRVLFQDRVDHALSKVKRSKTSIAVLFLDLDNFKAINDSMGHAAGDRLLVCVAERLQECLRHSDTAARLGGDEFAVLVESVYRAEEVVMIAERIKAVFREPFLIDGKEVQVATSIGVASSGSGVQSSEELLRNADLAMYLAKNQGKGNYVIFEQKMHEALMERIRLEEELKRAIEKKEFVIHYQPIVDLGSREMLGMEALVRWRHPRLGLLPPDRFIPVAEETNLIIPLGEWILREACSQTHFWREKYGEHFGISITVNLSIRQFHQPDLVAVVSAAIKDAGLPPGTLILEITESFMIQDSEATLIKLHELKALGVRLAIDDFGTGYSSLSYLQRFPIDILKIDKSFVEKIGQGKEGKAVARAIIMMGDSLNLKTIAEGIEHSSQIDELQELGCEAGQGFHFAKPLTKDDMDKFLSGRFSSEQR